ncbi:MAG: hypothetical protein GEU28_03195 [Dehalococcoidia bacterium]|nr:hypothetical protein [Dehalococcoidia bacterium]
MCAILACVAVGAAACTGNGDDHPQRPDTGEGSIFAETLAAEYRPESSELDGAPFYRIDASFDPASARLSGEQEVFLSSEVARTEVTLRVFANDDAFAVNGDNVQIHELTVDGQDAEWTLDRSLLRVALPQAVEGGDAVRLALSFEQGVPQLADPEPLDLGGEGGYGIYGSAEGITSLAHWHPVVLPAAPALTDLPAQGDISAFAAGFYDVTFEAPAGYEVATSGEEVERDDVNGGATRGRYVTVAARDFAIVLSPDFERLEEERDGVVYRVFYDSEDTDFREARDLLDYASGAVAVFSERFGPYIYDELDVVPISLRGGAGGIEFAGLIGIGASLYNGDPLGALGESSEDSGLLGLVEGVFGGGALDGVLGDLLGEDGDGSMLGLADVTEFVVAHEVAHQWWFNAVGSDSIEHPWMDESITNFSATLYFEDRYGPEAGEEQVQAQLILPFQTMGLLGAQDAVVNQPASAFSSSIEYSGVVYGKGGYFFVELRELVGDQAFFGGLAEYYSRYRYELAPNRAMVDIISELSGRPAEVDELYHRWIEETHGEDDLGSVSDGGGPLSGIDLGGVLDDLLDLIGD